MLAQAYMLYAVMLFKIQINKYIAYIQQCITIPFKIIVNSIWGTEKKHYLDRPWTIRRGVGTDFGLGRQNFFYRRQKNNFCANFLTPKEAFPQILGRQIHVSAMELPKLQTQVFGYPIGH